MQKKGKIMASVHSHIRKMYENGSFVQNIPFLEIAINDGITLSDKVNISEGVIKRTLEYLICLRLSKNTEEKLAVFEEPFIRASYINGIETARKLYCEALAGGESEIYATLKLASFCENAQKISYDFKISALPDSETLLNISKMAARNAEFFSGSRKILKFNFDFEGAYNSVVSCGAGDYLTKDGIWCISVSGALPSEFEFITLAAQYILGQYCHDAAKFRKIKKLGIFNPRLCKGFYVNVSDIPKSIISALTKELI